MRAVEIAIGGVVGTGSARIFGASNPPSPPSMRPFLAFTTLLTLAAPCREAAAQSTARDSVLATVQQAFDLMRSRDTAGMRQLFDSTARLIGVRDTATAIRPRTVSQFLAGVDATLARNCDTVRARNAVVVSRMPINRAVESKSWRMPAVSRVRMRSNACCTVARTLSRAVDWAETARQGAMRVSRAARTTKGRIGWGRG